MNVKLRYRRQVVFPEDTNREQQFACTLFSRPAEIQKLGNVVIGRYPVKSRFPAVYLPSILNYIFFRIKLTRWSKYLILIRFNFLFPTYYVYSVPASYLFLSIIILEYLWMVKHWRWLFSFPLFKANIKKKYG